MLDSLHQSCAEGFYLRFDFILDNPAVSRRLLSVTLSPLKSKMTRMKTTAVVRTCQGQIWLPERLSVSVQISKQGCCRISPGFFSRDESVFLVYLEHFRSRSKSIMKAARRKVGHLRGHMAGHSHGSKHQQSREGEKVLMDPTWPGKCLLFRSTTILDPCELFEDLCAVVRSLLLALHPCPDDLLACYYI